MTSTLNTAFLAGPVFLFRDRISCAGARSFGARFLRESWRARPAWFTMHFRDGK